MADRADGSVLIKAVVDADNAEKELNKLKRKISDTERDIEDLGKERLPLTKQLDELGVRLDQAKEKLNQMKSATNGAFGKEQIAEQTETVRSMQAEFDRVDGSISRIDRNIGNATKRLSRQKEEAGELVQKIEAVSASTRAMARAQEEAQKSAKRFGMRIREVVRSALVFTIITQALAKFREWMVNVIRTNAEASASVARLKGALLTLAQPLMNVIIPAFTFLVNLLTAVVSKIAQLTAALFGMTANEAAQAAEALNKEAEGIENVGKASKKSGKSLASFDQINQLSSSSDSGGSQSAAIAPDFSWASEMDGLFSRLAEYVLLIGAGFAMWKIGEGFSGVLGKVFHTVGGLAVAAGGLLILWEGLSDAWENGIDWDNFITMVGGAAAAVLGLWMAFGRIGGSIGLIVAGIALLVTGFKDVMENGFNLQNTLTVLAGIISTGLGLSWLVKSPIPAVIAAIGAILLAITVLVGNGGQLIGNLKQIFSGFVTFIDGIVNGDIDQILSGLKTMVFGILNAILTIVGSLVNAVIKGIGWLVDRINSIRFTVPDWVPGIGGKSLGFNLPKPKEWKIPQLAQGAVIPPNREFLAVLGDQKSGTNIETPLSTMVQAFKQAMAESGGGGDTTVILELDGQQFGKATFKAYNRESRRIGVNLAGVN